MTEMIPFHRPDVTEDDIRAVSACLRSGWLTSGQEVRTFEKAFAEFVEAAHAVAVSSATMASMMLFECMAPGGTEVLFPTYTFAGPVTMALKRGAKVRLVDSEPGGFNVDVELMAEAASARTSLAVPTHFAGAPVDLQRLRERLHDHVRIVEDAAHAFPAHRARVPVGRCEASDATFFSFYATKTLTTGDGGMVTTNRESLARRLRTKRSFGIDRDVASRYTPSSTGWDYDVVEGGWKANMTDVEAAMGLSQLRRATASWDARRSIALSYQMSMPAHVLPVKAEGGDAYHLFPILVEGRDEFVARMREAGVQCSVHFKPIHMHPYYQGLVALPPGGLRNAEHSFAREVSLPIWPGMWSAQVQQVIEAVNDVLAKMGQG